LPGKEAFASPAEAAMNAATQATTAAAYIMVRKRIVRTLMPLPFFSTVEVEGRYSLLPR